MNFDNIVTDYVSDAIFLYFRIIRRMADKRRREEKKLPDPFSYCEIPQLTRRGMVWKEIELTTVSESSGRGLIAKKELPEDLCIPYGGIYRTVNDRKSVSYVTTAF